MLDKLAEIIKPQLPSIVRRAMTAAAAFLATHGLLQSSETAQFVQLATAIILAAIPEVWSWVSNQIEQRKLVAAAITGNPVAAPASKAETKSALAIVQATAAPPPPPPPSVNLNRAFNPIPAAPPPAPPTPGTP